MTRYVSLEETQHCLRQWSIIDVRSHDRYRQRHIEGARWMSAAHALDIAREKFNKNEKFVLYDEGEGDTTAETVANQLASEGFTGISVLDGGYVSWAKHHLPTRRSSDFVPRSSR